jgi:SAM-dependent methyltransferase
MIRFSQKIFAYLNRRCLHIKPAIYRRHVHRFHRKSGIEIGGPSQVFGESGAFPIYPVAVSVDNCAFSTQTVWQHHTCHFSYEQGKDPGRQFICEASELTSRTTGRKYDFILSSHALEHISNPVKALLNWQDLLKEEGVLLLILPDSRHTFDRRRAVTPFEHFIEDYAKGTDESDLSHVDEVIEHHDYSLDPQADSGSFQRRCLQNYQNRCMHHHVFDRDNAARLLTYCNWDIEACEVRYPCHLVFLLCMKRTAAAQRETTFKIQISK